MSNKVEWGKVKNAPRNDNIRLTRPLRSHQYGLLHIAEEAPVQGRGQENGHGPQTEADGDDTVCCSRDTLDAVFSEMVIVVPCKDEELEVIRGVISQIPSPCLVILVSNSERGGDDKYMQQVAMVKTFRNCGRQILAIHQKDVAAAQAFGAAGMSELCDSSNGTIRNGKGEGMLLGIAIASAFCPGRRYIGFVDADNFYPDSVNEYCKAFAAGFAMSPSPELEDTMVRLRWASKPKVRKGEIEFVTEGRCSRIVNSWLNKLFVPTEGNGTPGTNNCFVTTGNAGEHALTMGLALKLRMAAGYAIEPFHFVDLLERAHLSVSGGTPEKHTTGTKKHPRPLDKPVRVLQIRTASPHFHRASDDDHIRRMWASGLGSIVHGLAPYRSMPESDDDGITKLREGIRQFAAKEGGIDNATGELPRPRIYPALEDINMARFREALESSLGKEFLKAAGYAGFAQA
ncbi:mannosyl-3-phosphoglycerate synthase [Parachaetomium inaequale]|uniref:Mannosyl-3-phosphoglycerate synthase n=1 Tax=Parachaetomium inaequale TaxID=2588326 RepID=A0AAN6PEH3_9PEZI|nr:mannosyl-3-phosphoglycerate synthase [Parachaetomium inaequale]